MSQEFTDSEIKEVIPARGVPMGRKATAAEFAARQLGGDVSPEVPPPSRLALSEVGTPPEKSPPHGIPFKLIPKERYTDPAYMQREWTGMWSKTWTLAGRVSDVTEPGDYFTYSLGKESFLIVRDEDQQLHAYYNVCLHRGNRLRSESGCGHAASFQCIYHHWEWHLDGSVKRIPDMDTFPNKLDCDALRLNEVKVGEWGGFVFINMDSNCESLEDFLGVIPEHLNPYRFDEMVLVSDQTVAWDCNWKTSVDAFNEAYHIQGIHPQLLSWMDDYYIQWDILGRHTRMLVPMGVPSPRFNEQADPSSDLADMIEKAGLSADDFKGRAREVRKAIQEHRRSRQDSEPHMPYANLNDDQLSDDYHYTIFPNWTMNINPDAMMLFLSRPHPTDPNKCYWDLQFYAYHDPSEPRPEPPERTYHNATEIDLGEVLNQDAMSLPYVQEGMNSDAYKGLILGEQEVQILAFHHALEEYVGPD